MKLMAPTPLNFELVVKKTFISSQQLEKGVLYPRFARFLFLSFVFLYPHWLKALFLCVCSLCEINFTSKIIMQKSKNRST